MTLEELKRQEEQLLEEIETMEKENVQLAGEQVAMKEMEEEMSDLFGVYWSQLNQVCDVFPQKSNFISPLRLTSVLTSRVVLDGNLSLIKL